MPPVMSMVQSLSRAVPPLSLTTVLMTVSCGAMSSLVMVPRPRLSEMNALALSLERSRLKVSLGSTLVSPVTSMSTDWLRMAVPAGKVSVPEAAV